MSLIKISISRNVEYVILTILRNNARNLRASTDVGVLEKHLVPLACSGVIMRESRPQDFHQCNTSACILWSPDTNKTVGLAVWC